jgi:hypothetical protein
MQPNSESHAAGHRRPRAFLSERHPDQPAATTAINMNKSISFGLIVIGITLIIFGVSASESVSSDFSRLFTGNPTDETIWLLVGGIALAAIGAFGLLRGAKA